MAFVYRSTPFPPPPTNLGPGTYSFDPLSLSKPTVGAAPFSSTVERFPEKKPQKKPPEFIIPGPGAYNVSKDLVTEKVLVSNMQNDMKIIEVPKESSVFKSKTEKMAGTHETKDMTPGPGYYTKDQNASSMMKKVSSNKELLNSAFLSTNPEKNIPLHPTVSLIEDIRINQLKYQLIPSIPSQKEAFGYTESERRELVLNKNPMLKHTGVGSDRIGPGQYEAKDSLDPRGYSWWKSNSKRIVGIKSQTLEVVGPGSYNPSLEIRKINKDKPTSAFLSKLDRSGEKGKARYVEVLENKLKEQQRMRSVDENGEGPFNVSAFEEQLMRSQINEATPGPGHYHNEKLRSSITVGVKPVEKQNFGSSDVRFKEEVRLGVGPGDYNPKKDSYNRRIKPRVNIPFISSVGRFENRGDGVELGPGSYNPPISLENELIRKIQNGYKGNFGSLEKRFDEKKEIMVYFGRSL